MTRPVAPFTADEMAGMTFPKHPDWGYLFMRAMATVKQETDENERLARHYAEDVTFLLDEVERLRVAQALSRRTPKARERRRRV